MSTTITWRIFLEICQWQNFQNRSTSAKVMNQVSYLSRQCVQCWYAEPVPEMTYIVFSGTLNPTHFTSPDTLSSWAIYQDVRPRNVLDHQSRNYDGSRLGPGHPLSPSTYSELHVRHLRQNLHSWWSVRCNINVGLTPRTQWRHAGHDEYKNLPGRVSS